MLQKLLPVILAIVGIGAGVGGGVALRPDPATVMLDPCGDIEHEMHGKGEAMEEEVPSSYEYVKLHNQFVIPDLDDQKVTALVVLSLSLEAKIGARESIYAMEPKLRDSFLQVLFDHANMGGFKGSFTDSTIMKSLRVALTEVAQSVVKQDINSVLILDIVRQDL